VILRKSSNDLLWANTEETISHVSNLKYSGGQCSVIEWITNINYIKCVGFEVLTPMVVKSTIFWNIALCSPLKGNQRFGGTYRLHLQGRIISCARNQLVTCS
jgi:hypothetical protein